MVHRTWLVGYTVVAFYSEGSVGGLAARCNLEVGDACVEALAVVQRECGVVLGPPRPACACHCR